jgi:capsid protein
MNTLDRLIEWVSPRRALARTRSRAAIEQVRDYEGASRGRRMTGWNPRATSANAETQGQLGFLRDRSRDLVRNNAWAGQAVRVIAHNTVGTGIIPQASTKRVQKLWAQWGGKTQCDADGVLNFYGIQKLVMRTVAESGECLVLQDGRRGGDNFTKILPLSMYLVLESLLMVKRM